MGKKSLVVKKFFALLLCCIFLTGCSGQSENPVSGAPSADVPSGITQESASPEAISSLMIDRDLIFDIDYRDESEKETGLIVGLQFYQGEPVLLEVKAYHITHSEGVLIDGQYHQEREAESELYQDSGLYIRKRDGSRELLIPGARLVESIGSILSEEEKEKEMNVLTYNQFIRGGTWYVDEEENCYYTTCPNSISGYAIGKECFLKMDRNGNLLYTTVLEPGFEAEGFCCISGSMYVILRGKVEGVDAKRLVAFDSETGVLADTDAFVLQTRASDRDNPFGWGEDGLYLYDEMGVDAGRKGKGIKKVNLSDGTVSDFLSFDGSAWTLMSNPWRMRGFRVLKEGGVEALYFSDERNGYVGGIAEGILEKLSVLKGERKIVTLRAATIPQWLRLQAMEFNKTDREYLVVLEELSTSRAADLADYARMTNVELSAGKGPDILSGDLLEDYLQGMLDKGMLLDLGGSLEAMLSNIAIAFFF